MFVYLHLTAFRHVLFIVYLFKVYIKGSEIYIYIYVLGEDHQNKPEGLFFLFVGGGRG